MRASTASLDSFVVGAFGVTAMGGAVRTGFCGKVRDGGAGAGVFWVFGASGLPVSPATSCAYVRIVETGTSGVA